MLIYWALFAFFAGGALLAPSIGRRPHLRPLLAFGAIVTALLIRDFGRPTQSEQLVDIELLPGKGSDEVRIGKIDFRR